MNFNEISTFRSHFSFFFVAVVPLKSCRNEQNKVEKIFRLIISLDNSKRVFSSFELSERVCFLFLFSRKISFSQFPVVMSTLKMLNSNSVFSSLRKSARNCPQSKVSKWEQSSRFSLRLFRSKSGQFVNDFSVQHNRSLSFFAVAAND